MKSHTLLPITLILLFCSCKEENRKDLKVNYNKNQCYNVVKIDEGEIVRSVPYFLENISSDTIIIFETEQNSTLPSGGVYFCGNKECEDKVIKLHGVGTFRNSYASDSVLVPPGYSKLINLLIGRIPDSINYIGKEISYLKNEEWKIFDVRINVSQMKRCIDSYPVFNPNTGKMELP